jgi:hypothetical protein
METANILESISVIIAAWTVIIGISAWRREFIGKRRIELAEDALTLFYQAQDVIDAIRNPFASADEGTTREPSKNETPEEKEIYDRAYVVNERFNKNIELFNKLHALRYRFMVQFGIGTSKPFDDLRKIILEIQLSARMLSSLWLQQSRKERLRGSWSKEQEFQDWQNQYSKYSSIFWAGLPDQDPITPKTNALIEDIEGLCRPIIEQKTLYQRFIEWNSKV